MKRKVLTNFQKIKEFHSVFGRTPDPETPTQLTEKSRTLRATLIAEEFCEVFSELGMPRPELNLRSVSNDIQLTKLAKEIADLLYVVYGTSAAYGIDIDKVFDLVHQNNMSKLDENGKVVRREDGKVIKPPNYKPLELKMEDLT